jgi:hypothetical protein
MRVSRITAAWLAELITLADDDIPDLLVSLTDGDECPPDKISVVWSETVEPTAPPLHLYDLDYEIRTPSDSDLTMEQHETAEAWILAQLDDEDNYDDLAEALEGIGTLNDWFIGVDGDVDRSSNFITTRREIRLAIVHG